MDELGTLVLGPAGPWSPQRAAESVRLLAHLVSPAIPAEDGLRAWSALVPALPAPVAREARRQVWATLRALGPASWHADPGQRALALTALHGVVLGQASPDVAAPDAVAAEASAAPGAAPTAPAYWGTLDAADTAWCVAAVTPEVVPSAGPLRLDETHETVLAHLAQHAQPAGTALDTLRAIGRVHSRTQRALAAAGRAADLPVEHWSRRPEAERLELARDGRNMDGLLRLVSPARRARAVLETLGERTDLRADVAAAVTSALGLTLEHVGWAEDRERAEVLMGGEGQAGQRRLQTAGRVARLFALPEPLRAAAVQTLAAGVHLDPARRQTPTWDPGRVMRGMERIRRTALDEARYYTEALLGRLGAEDVTIQRAWAAWLPQLQGMKDPMLVGTLPWHGVGAISDPIRLFSPLASVRTPEGWLEIVRLSAPWPEPTARLEVLARALPGVLAAWTPAQWAELLATDSRDLRLAAMRARSVVRGAPATEPGPPDPGPRPEGVATPGNSSGAPTAPAPRAARPAR